LGICLLQQHFGLVALSDSVVESYPVKVMWTDLVLVTVAVLGIGLLATWVPLRTLSRRFLHATSANP
jgi:lipoprotein-releasing system permease protein